VTGCKLGVLIVIVFVALSAALVVASPSLATTSKAAQARAKLQAKLDKATTDLNVLKPQLEAARVSLKAGLATSDTVAVAAARDIIRAVKPQVKKLTVRITRIRFILDHPMAAGRNGSWMPVIKMAAKHFHLRASSLRHMMMLESSGNAHNVTGPFKGLYQYCNATWNAAWNPFRKYGIFNGGAQVWATATAIHRGWGPHMWPNTYPMSF
jgi:hypothetical protein